MAKSLLQEAIAEAKQLREAAIQNATKQLEENLTPSIKEMLAQKLEEELSLDENEEETQIDENSNSGFKEVKLKEAEEDPKDEEEPKEDDAPADDAAADADAAAEDADAAAEDADDAVADADADAAEDPAAEEEQSDDTPLKDITLGDLRTLIQDIVAAGAAPAPEGDLGADLDAGGVEGMGDEAPAGDLAADPAAPAAEDPAADSAADPNADPEAEDEKLDIDISEILRELEEEEKGKCPECGKDKANCICKENKANDIMPQNQNGKEHHKESSSGPSQDDEGLQKENKELKAKVKELEEGLKKVTKTLNDVNLLNGKLVYTTRLLNRQNLSESQKANVLKTLDGAKSTTEVKTLYKTLLEGLKSSQKKSVVAEGRRGSASRPAGGSTASTILEGDEMVRRFQELAGIIKG